MLKFCFYIVIVLCLSVSTAFAASMQDVDALVKAKKYSEAYQALEEIQTAKKQDKAEFYTLMGDLAYQLGHYAKAGRHYEDAYNISKSKTTDMAYNVAAAYYRAGQIGNAARMCQLLLNDKGLYKNLNYVELCAVVLADNGQGAQAKQILQTVLKSNPNNMRLWKILGNVALAMDDFTTLAMVLEVVYAVEPPQPEKWLDLGNVYIYANSPARALASFKKGYGTTTDPTALRRMSQAAFDSGLFAEGLAYLDQAIAVSSGENKAKLYYEKGFMLYDHGQWQNAIEAFRACIAADVAGKHTEALLFIGYSQLELKQVAAARDTFKRSARNEKIGSYAESMLELIEELYPNS